MNRMTWCTFFFYENKRHLYRVRSTNCGEVDCRRRKLGNLLDNKSIFSLCNCVYVYVLIVFVLTFVFEAGKRALRVYVIGTS